MFRLRASATVERESSVAVNPGIGTGPRLCGDTTLEGIALSMENHRER